MGDSLDQGQYINDGQCRIVFPMQFSARAGVEARYSYPLFIYGPGAAQR